MNLDELIAGLPGYAKDLTQNYSALVLHNTELTVDQLWGTVVATAVATRCAELTAAAVARASEVLSPAVLEAVKASAALMGMNNVYYRFHHLTKNEMYATLPARLRMNGLRGHAADAVDFELWCLAVSAVNACGKCVDSHEQVLRDKMVTERLINAVIRVTSVIHAIGVVLDAERAVSASAKV